MPSRMVTPSREQMSRLALSQSLCPNWLAKYSGQWHISRSYNGQGQSETRQKCWTPKLLLMTLPWLHLLSGMRFIFFNLFKIVPSGAIHIMSSSLWVPSVRECTVVDFIQYVRRALWFDWVHIKQLDQNRLNIKVEIKKKRYSYFSFSSMNHEKVKTNNICVKRSVILSGHVCGTQQ